MTAFKLLSLLSMVLTLLLPQTCAFHVSPQPSHHNNKNVMMMDRRQSLTGLVSAVLGTVVVTNPTNAAFADVWSGNELPKGASQFNRVIRLRSDLKKIKKRVIEGGSDIDKAEWENIGQFLRAAYATGEDMKAVSAGIQFEENKKRALEDIEQMRKYAQAGDVSVSKQDGAGFVAVAEKMETLVNDYFAALTDVPDEI